MLRTIPHNRPWFGGPFEDAALRVLRSGYVGQGPEVQALERDLAVRFGRPSCVVSSGTAALYLAFRVWIGREPVVLHIPTYACTAIAEAARLANLNYLLMDCDPLTFNPIAQPDEFGVRLALHTYGVPMDASECLIEDITHAIGATLDGKLVGTMSRLAVCSMGPTKLLSSPGGGFIIGDSDVIEECRKLRDSLNLTMSDLHATIARERLKRFDEEIFTRWEIADDYTAALPNELRVVGEGPDECFCWSRDGQGFARIWYRYVIRVKDWRKAQAHFARRGIETINPLMTEELLHRHLGLPASDFPNAEEVAASTLSLPIYPSLTSEERQRVADALAELEG